jgi:hypothetical protein
MAKTKKAQREKLTNASNVSPKTARTKTAQAKSPPSGIDAERAEGVAASRKIDERIKSLGDWRGETLADMRRLIHEADPEIVEEWKWMGTPVWSHAGNVCTGETYKQVVKLTFARGASLPDPRGLFNSSLEGNTRRAIDLREGEAIDARAFKALIKAAVAENLRASAATTKPTAKGAAGKSGAKPAKVPLPAKQPAGKVVLLSGGNPQIAKADGDAPVQAYIAAMPGWKRGLGQRLDDLIVRAVPQVRKAVRWNSPFYGVEGRGWFLSFHVLTRYVKVTFFSGRSLQPIPPGGTPKSGDSRWIDLYEDQPLDEAQMESWVKQAAALPGWTP